MAGTRQAFGIFHWKDADNPLGVFHRAVHDPDECGVLWRAAEGEPIFVLERACIDAVIKEFELETRRFRCACCAVRRWTGEEFDLVAHYSDFHLWRFLEVVRWFSE